ncbi:hypothetical protein ACLOJK_001149 [Asimina triloba]
MQRTVGTGRLNRENRLNHGSTPHPARISLPPPSLPACVSLLPSLPFPSFPPSPAPVLPPFGSPSDLPRRRPHFPISPCLRPVPSPRRRLPFPISPHFPPSLPPLLPSYLRPAPLPISPGAVSIFRSPLASARSRLLGVVSLFRSPPISLLPSLPCSRPTSALLPFRSPQAPSPFSDLPLPPPGPVSSASSPFSDLPPAPARSRLPLDSIEEANLRLSMRLDAFQSASSSELLLFMGLFDSMLQDACWARFFLKFYDSKDSKFGWNGSTF